MIVPVWYFNQTSNLITPVKLAYRTFMEQSFIIGR
jgi:hypothetical protein